MSNSAHPPKSPHIEGFPSSAETETTDAARRRLQFLWYALRVDRNVALLKRTLAWAAISGVTCGGPVFEPLITDEFLTSLNEPIRRFASEATYLEGESS